MCIRDRESDVYAVSLGQCPVAYQDPDQGAIRPGDRIQVGYGGTVEETFPCLLYTSRCV